MHVSPCQDEPDPGAPDIGGLGLPARRTVDPIDRRSASSGAQSPSKRTGRSRTARRFAKRDPIMSEAPKNEPTRLPPAQPLRAVANRSTPTYVLGCAPS